jgi:hypothetical protein
MDRERYLQDTEGILRHLFRELRDGKALKDEREYCAHIGLAGPDWKEGGWAFYGRAQNGWPARFRKSDLGESTLQSVVREVIDTGTRKSLCCLGDVKNPNQYIDAEHLSDACSQPNSMHWIEHRYFWGKKRVCTNNIKHHRFWGMADRIMRSSPGWPANILWSNLYKVAPLALNPRERLKTGQACACAKLIRLELESFRPGAVVMMTAPDWYDSFGKALVSGGCGWTPKPSRDASLVPERGVLELPDGHRVDIFVTVRPEARKLQPMIDAILSEV